jgi:uroporphyrinogen decarboxylase
MNSRERIMAALNGEKMDRIPMLEIAFWPETIERWHKEGLPSGCTPNEYFGLDTMGFFTYDGSLQLVQNILEENKEIKIYTDGDGCTYKAFKNKTNTPQFLESKIKNIEDWEKYKANLRVDFKRFMNCTFDPLTGNTLNKTQDDLYKESIANGTITVLVPIEPCWYFLRLLGEEEALVAMAESPDFVEQVISDYNNFNIDMIEEITNKGYKFDAMWVFSDLCYKNGMLFSPKFYKERVLPYHKRFFDFCKNKGMKVIYHCDGNISNLLPLLIEAGIDCIQPMEARAGNNVIEYSRLYKKISFLGNINADILSTSKERIFEEISTKIKGVKESKRYLFHSDHSLPPTISFENYEYAIEVAREFGKYE